MATSRTAKLDAEIAKTKAKISEQQGRLRELEQKRTECENMEIVDIVRSQNISLDQLAEALQTIKNGTSGQLVPKLKNEIEQEEETE